MREQGHATLRYPMALAALAAFLVGGVLDAQASRIYVANQDDGTISVVDAKGLKPLATIDAKGKNTHDLWLSPDGRRLFATNMATGTISVVDTAKNEVIATVSTGRLTHTVATTPNGKELWINAGNEDHIPIVDAASLKIVAKVPLGEPIGTGHVWFTSDGKRAYMTSPKFAQVFVLESITVLGRHSVPDEAHRFAVIGQTRLWSRSYPQQTTGDCY